MGSFYTLPSAGQAYVIVQGFNDVAIQTALNSMPASGGTALLSAGTYTINNTVQTLANQRLQGMGVGTTILQSVTATYPIVKMGKAQITSQQYNNMGLRDMTIQHVGGASTSPCVWVDGGGFGTYIENVQTNQGQYGFLLTDLDRCYFINIQANNQRNAGIRCEQGVINTWGTVTFIDPYVVISDTNGLGWQFAANASQAAPVPFNRVGIYGCLFFATPGVTGSVGLQADVGINAAIIANSLFENNINHIILNGQSQLSLQSDYFLQNSGVSTNCVLMNTNPHLVMARDCVFQQSTNVFNGASGNPSVAVEGFNINNGSLTNIFTGTFTKKQGTDTVFAGNQILALGLNNQQFNFLFANNFVGGPPLKISPNSDSATALQLTNAAGSTSVLTVDTTNTQLITGGSVSTPVSTKTGAYTLLPSDSTVLGNATAAAFTLTLPTAIGAAGRRYALKKIDSSANAVTVGTTLAQTIDGATTKVLSTQFANVDLVSDGANWQII